MAKILRTIRNFALQNALRYEKPNPKAVLGKLFSERKDLRKQAKEIVPLVTRVCSELSHVSHEEMKKEILEYAPELLETEKKKKSTELPELPNADGEVVMRFAPGPSGPLHIGHSRAAIINDEYVKRFGGKFILRLEDTNPMKILPEAYEMIPEDMEWLGVKVHETVVQSARFDIYPGYAEKLINLGKAYVCTCDVEDWRELKNNKKPCVHRDLSLEKQKEEWKKMVSGEYDEGEASLIIKTDIRHPNPAVRDFVAMRINRYPHPRTGKEFSVYPLYNFSVAVDDHLMGITHVLRGKDHLNNSYKQKYVYKYFGWREPEFIHYGWVSIPDTLLKTSSIKEGIDKGEYSGWDDIRLATFRALERRGFQPEALRRYWKKAGINEVDIKFSWKSLIAINKELIDPIAPRFFFTANPVELTVTHAVKLVGRAPFFPDRPEEGHRNVKLESDGIGIRMLISEDDAKNISEGDTVRLKDLCNVKVTKKGEKGIAAKFTGNDLIVLKEGARNIHWCPKDGLETVVKMPDGKSVKGRTERTILQTDSRIVQFERFGFVRTKIDKENEMVEAFFTHN